MSASLTRTEKQIIRLIQAGFTRKRIAELAVVDETTAREIIRGLCERYDCRQWDLPTAAEGDY